MALMPAPAVSLFRPVIGLHATEMIPMEPCPFADGEPSAIKRNDAAMDNGRGQPLPAGLRTIRIVAHYIRTLTQVEGPPRTLSV